MKDKIISFLLISIIIGILGVIGTLGYIVYTEISEEGTIQLNFESETGFPKLEFVPTYEDLSEVILNEEMFSGVEGNTSKIKEKQSRYLYEQLDDTAKIIYKKLYENKENLKTGTYKIEFGNTFQELLSQENGDKELKIQYQSAIEALVYENPDIFYIDVTKMYINIEKITKITGTKYNVYIDQGSDVCYLTDGFLTKEDVEEYETKVEEIKDKVILALQGKSDYEKIRAVHDFLIDTVEYENDLNQENIYDIYGALVTKRCVCEGYAKAYQYLMSGLGVETTIVIGEATNSKNETESHAWNYVNLDGQWYAVDVTWDDPIITGVGILTNKSKYEYFLKGSETMNENHMPSGKFTDAGKIFSYPELSVEDYEE